MFVPMLLISVSLGAEDTALPRSVQVLDEAALIEVLSIFDEQIAGPVYLDVPARQARNVVSMLGSYPDLQVQIVTAGEAVPHTMCRLELEPTDGDSWTVQANAACEHVANAPPGKPPVVGTARIATDGTRVCLSDGQRLEVDLTEATEEGVRLVLANAFIDVPQRFVPAICRSRLHWTQGSPTKIRAFELPRDQVLYGKEGKRGNESAYEVLLLNHDGIFVQRSMVLAVSVPDRADPVVRSARRSQALRITGVAVGCAAVVGVTALVISDWQMNYHLFSF